MEVTISITLILFSLSLFSPLFLRPFSSSKNQKISVAVTKVAQKPRARCFSKKLFYKLFSASNGPFQFFSLVNSWYCLWNMSEITVRMSGCRQSSSNDNALVLLDGPQYCLPILCFALWPFLSHTPGTTAPSCSTTNNKFSSTLSTSWMILDPLGLTPSPGSHILLMDCNIVFGVHLGNLPLSEIGNQ